MSDTIIDINSITQNELIILIEEKETELQRVYKHCNEIKQELEQIMKVNEDEGK